MVVAQCPRGHSEQIAVEGETEPVLVKLGVWVSNTKSRRDKLTPEQRAALAALGIDWAGAPAPTTQAVPARPAADSPARPVAPRCPAVRMHHDECEKMQYEGGTCSCDLIQRLGPPSERESL